MSQAACRELYDELAATYDAEVADESRYFIPALVREIYAKYAISDGIILDVGCGTGRLSQYVNGSFSFVGIELAPLMARQARSRGYEVHVGPAEEIICKLSSRSVDHIVALSSLYFIKDIERLVAQFERVARKSIFLTLEQFQPEEIARVAEARQLAIYNHPTAVLPDPTEVRSNIRLWNRASNGAPIDGNVVFKLL